MDVHKYFPEDFRPNNCTENEFLIKEQSDSFIFNVLYLFSIFLTAIKLKNNVVNSALISGIILNVLGLLMAPLIVVFLLALAIYRKIVYEIDLKKRPNFCGLLSGLDAYWAMKDVTTKPIINVLLTLKVNGDAREVMVKAVEERMLEHGPERLFCTTKWTKYGYCYWEKIQLDLNRQIRSYDFSHLEDSMSKLANERLPDGTLWEILVGENDNGTAHVLFRIDHCIGDGFYLMKVFLEAIVDESRHTKVDLRSLQRSKSFIKRRDSVFDKLLTLIYVPQVIGKMIFYKGDSNELHSKRLSGEKLIVWKDYELSKIKEIKNKKMTTFTGVLMYAIAKSLQSNISNEQITLVLPAKVVSDNITLSLFNLPLRTKNLFEDISEKAKNLKYLPDFLVNYWLLKLGFGVVPLGMLKSIESRATMIMSNVPGPRKSAIFNNEVQDIKFWIPHRNKTGVGISILSYNGRVQFGLSADKSCLQNSNEASAILERIVQNLDQMYQ